MSRADHRDVERIEAELASWKDRVLTPVEARRSPRRGRFETPSGTVLAPVHTPADPDGTYLEALGFPGEPPFTRGVRPNMYRGRH